MRVAIIGAGMAGILSAIKLKEAGVTDVVVYEKADRCGGTWRENTYPGIGCDVPSHLYSYSFAPNPEWSHYFSPGAEIRDYLERVAREHGVAGAVRFGEEVTRLAFADGGWHLETASGRRDAAEIVIAATGVLHHPRYPDIEGLDAFAGARFHSARWDHGVALDGRRVGIIGTGSTAVQIVSALVDRVGKLALFQRTAQWIMPQENVRYSADEHAAWRRNPDEMRLLRASISQIFADHFANAVVDAESPQMRVLDEMCRYNLETSVADPALRDRLRPDYHAACKRLVISGDFYQAIQKPNAELVTSGIARVEPEGVRTRDGRLHPLDVLVLATGFRVDRFLRPIEVVGHDGLRLETAWAARPSAYLSVAIPGFPNLFLLNGPNGPVGNFSLIEVAELQFAYVAQLIELLRAGRCREVAATAAATERFEAERVVAARKTVWMTGCRSWYLDDRGIPAAWPWSFDRFREEMAAPRLDAYELR
jgi:cation diffusion facilitator CzcD-associated flavoprotein CzcO